MDMAELEIDKEDVQDSKKWRGNVMKRKSKPIEKTDYKPIIYITHFNNFAKSRNIYTFPLHNYV